MKKDGKLPVAGSRFSSAFFNITIYLINWGNYWSKRGVKNGILDLQF
ncbi:hypothetical protein OQ279_14550 [Salinimicrobium sp. MT39]|uniref:Uncharacterized protein n=1 Tax=Salinimicrobium profundisediminis TaxID=2994553 RepID=A0A9X3CYN8_9FLAO|nr:hypothetical protein [Salinimicrobium profundisediminis]